MTFSTGPYNYSRFEDRDNEPDSLTLAYLAMYPSKNVEKEEEGEGEELVEGDGLTPLQRETRAQGVNAVDIVKKRAGLENIVGTAENNARKKLLANRMSKVGKPVFAPVNQQANMDNAFKPRRGTSD